MVTQQSEIKATKTGNDVWEPDLSGDQDGCHRPINRACVLSLAYFAGESGVRQAEVGLCLEHVWEQGLPHTGLSSSPNS